jgi:hypothetical protein
VTTIPTEIELAFEVMPCNALRTAQSPGSAPHACSYFRKWGKYHSYDYDKDGPPPARGIVHLSQYVGRAALVPEMLSGCRKAPILALGINPNLPGWWPGTRSSLNPLFDDYQQYAHYFRYRATAKLALSPADYAQYGGASNDSPFDGRELDVPRDAAGQRTIAVQLQEQKMYSAYQSLLESLGEAMGWTGHELRVGEDLSYGNMVACPSAKWTVKPDPKDSKLPPMTESERGGIVRECFRDRKYFLRQLFQSLPSVLLVFSQNTANAFVGELQGRFSKGDVKPGDSVEALMGRDVRLHYGDLPDGRLLEAKVIFAPHPTGDPVSWQAARPQVIARLIEAAQGGELRYEPATHHLGRPGGSCVFCPGLGIGDCDYAAELVPLAKPPELSSASGGAPGADKPLQRALLDAFLQDTVRSPDAWDGSDDAT